MLGYGICNVTYRLDKTERLLFELDYEVMIVTTRIVVNFTIIIKAIFGDKKRLYILTQQISGNRACMYALSCSRDTKKLNLGRWGGTK